MAWEVRLGECPVCWEPVRIEAGAPRTYRVDDAFEPHYCDPLVVRDRLLGLQVRFEGEESVTPVSEAAVGAEDVPIYERPEYQDADV